MLRMLLFFALNLIFLSLLKRNLASFTKWPCQRSSNPDSDVVSVLDSRDAMVTVEGLLILLTLFLNLVLNESILFAWTVSLDRWFQSSIVLGKNEFMCWVVLDAGTI